MHVWSGGGSKSVKGPLEVGEGEYKQAPTFIRMQVMKLIDTHYLSLPLQ